MLVPDDGEPVCGEDEILQYLSRFGPGPGSDAHRERAREEVPAFTPL